MFGKPFVLSLEAMTTVAGSTIAQPPILTDTLLVAIGVFLLVLIFIAGISQGAKT